jgi:hypothetical protein
MFQVTALAKATMQKRLGDQPTQTLSGTITVTYIVLGDY